MVTIDYMKVCHHALSTINSLAFKNCPSDDYEIFEDIMDTYDYNEELKSYKDNIKDISDYLYNLTNLI